MAVEIDGANNKVKTVTLAFTDGDTAFTIADGGGVTVSTSLDMNGTELILDADADTSITADTDDQIDFKIGGTDALRVTGTALTGNAVATIGAAGTASSIAGLPIYVDSSSNSVYTHDVSGTDNSADNNTAFGLNAADAITTADSVTVFGRSAGSAITTGSSSTFFGKEAGLAVTEGTNNIFMGVNAGHDVTTGGSNIAIGATAYDGCDTESHNLAIGRDALGGSIAGGEYNVAVGNYAGDAITTSDHNCLMGYQAGGSITLANSDGSSANGSNACFGNYAGSSITSGYQNTCIGMQAGAGEGDGIGTDPTNGTRNILIGPFANTSGSADVSHAIAIGYAISTGSNNFVFGKASNVVLNDFDTDANWSRSSDVRKKRNINSQGLGLDFINDLRTVNFQWKPSNEFPKEWDDYSEENNMNLDVVMHGFIAQEVKETLDKHAKDQDKNFSGWTVGKDGMQNTSREMFVIPLIKAVQELSAQVEELKAKLEDK